MSPGDKVKRTCLSRKHAMMCGADHATIATVQFVILLYNTPSLPQERIKHLFFLDFGPRLANAKCHGAQSVNVPMSTLGEHTPIFILCNLHKERT